MAPGTIPTPVTAGCFGHYSHRVLNSASLVKKRRNELKIKTKAPTVVILSAQDFLRNDISLQAKGLWGYLLAFADLNHVTVKGISMNLREAETTVRGAMTELEAIGVVDDVQ